MSQPTCLQCRTPIPARKEGQFGRRRIYCSKACSRRASRERVTAICEREGCERKVQARGMCGSHYGTWYKATHEGAHQRSRESEKRHERTCVACGNTWLTTRKDAKYCTQLCRDFDKWGPRFSPWSPPARALVKWVKPIPVAAPQPRPRRWVAGQCAWCGERFVVQASEGRYCSRLCSKRHGRAKRRGAERKATGCYTWAEVTRKWIEIGKVCAYCHEATRNGDLEPDHVHPLSRGGSNSITNVVPCCKPCNQDKRALLLPEWAESRVRRGLPTLHLHPHLTCGVTVAA